MYEIDANRAFELAADRKLDDATKSRVRELILRSLESSQSPSFFIRSKEDADIFRQDKLTKSDLYYKVSELLNSNFELANKLLNIVEEISAEQRKSMMNSGYILKANLPEDIQILFEEPYVKEI